MSSHLLAAVAFSITQYPDFIDIKADGFGKIG